MHSLNYKKRFDPLLIILPLLIFFIGLVFLYSASSGIKTIKGIDYTLRQLIWLTIGLAVVLIVVNIDFRRLVDLSYIFYALVTIALFIVLMTGGSRMGAKRWLDIGGFTFQPSEFAKLALILGLSFYLGNNRYSIRGFRTFFGAAFITLFLFILIFKEPDLGSALALFPILFAVLAAAAVPFKYIFGSVFLGLAASPLFWNIMKDYQKRRLLVFLNPNMDPLGAGYTVIQSKIAIGSGGLLGKGWMGGTQSQLNFLPERHTDFIFSVVGEEWGFLGCLLVILLYTLLLLRILAVAEKTNDVYGKLIVAGVAGMLAFQMIVNIAMTAGFMPVVGLPLPFISYGGSSLIMSMAAIALVINVDMRKTVF